MVFETELSDYNIYGARTKVEVCLYVATFKFFFVIMGRKHNANVQMTILLSLSSDCSCE